MTTTIKMQLKRKDKIAISFFLLFMWGLFLISLFIREEPNERHIEHPVIAETMLFFMLCFLTFLIFHYCWINVEADLYKITITGLWGGETVLFYQDYIIETLTTQSRYGENYFIRFASFENNKSYLIPSYLKNFNHFTDLLLKNKKITGVP